MLASAPWLKGASREIDCRAIGGLGGCKRFAQGWVGENADCSDRTLRPSQVATRSDTGAVPESGNERAWREHPSLFWCAILTHLVHPHLAEMGVTGKMLGSPGGSVEYFSMIVSNLLAPFLGLSEFCIRSSQQ